MVKQQKYVKQRKSDMKGQILNSRELTRVGKADYWCQGLKEEKMG
jgi:hypothetical protein